MCLIMRKNRNNENVVESIELLKKSVAGAKINFLFG